MKITQYIMSAALVFVVGCERETIPTSSDEMLPEQASNKQLQKVDEVAPSGNQALAKQGSKEFQEIFDPEVIASLENSLQGQGGFINLVEPALGGDHPQGEISIYEGAPGGLTLNSHDGRLVTDKRQGYVWPGLELNALLELYAYPACCGAGGEVGIMRPEDHKMDIGAWTYTGGTADCVSQVHVRLKIDWQHGLYPWENLVDAYYVKPTSSSAGLQYLGNYMGTWYAKAWGDHKLDNDPTYWGCFQGEAFEWVAYTYGENSTWKTWTTIPSP